MPVATSQDARKKMTMARAQENLYSLNVVRKVAKVDSNSMGTVYNPYTTLPSVSSGTTTGPTYTVNDYSVAADSLQVNKRAQASEHVDSYDFKSVDFGLIRDRADNFGSVISNTIDRAVLAGIPGTSGIFALGDAGVDGSTTPWTTSNTNMDDVVNAVIQTVDLNEGHGKKKFLVVSPYEANDLRSFIQNTGNNYADAALQGGGFSRSNGFVGTTFSGVDIYQTNNLKNVAVLTFSGTATNNQTITINGIVFTTVTSIGSTAGNVLIGADVDATVTNIAALINAPGTTTAQGVALSSENQAKVARLGLTAAASTANDTVTITANATLVVSETQTNASWGAVSRYLVGGAYESIFLALPSAGMDYVEKEVSGKAGYELYMEQFFNWTIWTRNLPLVGTVLVN